MTPSRTFALIATATLAIAACGGDDDDATDRAFVTAMVEQGATENEAECLADELGDDLRESFMSGADGPSTPEDGEAILEAYEACEIDLAELGETSGSSEEGSG